MLNRFNSCSRQQAHHLFGGSRAGRSSLPCVTSPLQPHRAERPDREAARSGSSAATLDSSVAPSSSTAAAVTDARPSLFPAAAPPLDRRSLGEAERESLELLGWTELCRQVASHCSTPMGAQQAIGGHLPSGRTLEESQALLSQTREAFSSGQYFLNFSGIFYLERALDAAEAGQGLHPLVAGAVATTMAAAARLGRAVADGGEATMALQQLSADIAGALPDLQAAIQSCINVTEGRVLDSASPLLAQTRSQRQLNLSAVRRTADEWAKTLYDSGASERQQVVLRRDRLCVPVRSGRQAELPRGSVALATSASGNTVYMEPQPLVALNNAEAALGAAEREEEDRIMGEISAAVAAAAPEIRRILQAVAALDIASARARHARWCGAVEPEMRAAGGRKEGKKGMQTVSVRGALHPLLLEPLLPPLPRPPLPEVTMSMADSVNLVPELWTQRENEIQKVKPKQPKRRNPTAGAAVASGEQDETLLPVESNNGNGSSSAAAGSSDGPSETLSSSSSSGKRWPVAIDLIVPPGKSVVAVTGPNTGGKTASLKALGLLSLMAKAGLFLPVSSQHANYAQHAQHDGPPAVVKMAWFDRILVDIGDGQSLQQSLSTFSGHVRRLRGVLRETTPSSIVLLDEVGSGTDPGEGAALAAALLLRLAAGRAALTFATTHHAELKELATTHPAFVNASVEFDVATLRPTYRLLWGTSGDSNALAVAQGLGFDSRVVEDARQVAAQLAAGGADGGARAAALQRSLEEQVAAAAKAAAAAKQRRKACEAGLKEAKSRLKAQEDAQEAARTDAAKFKAATAEAQRKVRSVVSAASTGGMTFEAAQAELRRMERSVERTGFPVMDLDVGIQQLAIPDGWAPQPGDNVKVLKMGGAAGVVASLSSGGKSVTVRVGTLTMQLSVQDLAPASAFSSSKKAGSMATPSSPSSGASSSIHSGSGGVPRSRGVKASGSSGSRGNSSSGMAAFTGVPVAVQTSRNTIDVRGMAGNEAASEVGTMLRTAGRGSVIFVIHGVGMGRVKAAVMDVIRRSPAVARSEEEENSRGGATVVYLK